MKEVSESIVVCFFSWGGGGLSDPGVSREGFGVLCWGGWGGTTTYTHHPSYSQSSSRNRHNHNTSQNQNPNKNNNQPLAQNLMHQQWPPCRPFTTTKP